jgi:hypothetical protein
VGLDFFKGLLTFTVPLERDIIFGQSGEWLDLTREIGYETPDIRQLSL